MTAMSMNQLIERIAALQNPTVAGLDPKLDYVPEYLRKEAVEMGLEEGREQILEQQIQKKLAKGK